jgi:hypothetical protein
MSTITSGNVTVSCSLSADTTGNLVFQSGGNVTAMTIDTSQNVGIGTTSPSSYSFDTGVDLVVGDGNNSAISVVSSSAGTGYVAFADGTSGTARYSGLIEYNHTDNYLGLRTSAVERARIDSSGNLLIGTTSADAKFVVTSSATSGWGARILQSSGSGTPQGLQVVVGQNSTNEVFQCGQGTSFGSVTNLFRVTGNGTINTGTASGSPYNLTSGSAANAFLNSNGDLQRSTSSLKYKRDVQDAAYGLADVMALRAVTYKGKSESDGDKVFGGLIAEEVHEAGLTEFVQYAEDGSPDALAYGNMVSLCIKAIQEQQQMIDELKAKVAALEAA